ncbi:hypothetical protein FGLOB1_952 [Fusarium globosum]|uniref:Uncharacterized protein n=1 Tax=Fusarium globosum TaxID=78864 RepID=A0A8H5YYE4_9HYPO|nr:hypothetical protein FGLOB1_952 [Fusarium globosum]
MKPASKRTGSECATSSSTPRHLRLSLSQQVFGRAKAAESRTESGSSLPPSYGSYAVCALVRANPYDRPSWTPAPPRDGSPKPDQGRSEKHYA